MPLCLMEGPDGGTVKAFGRKPLTRLGELLLNLRGFSLKRWLNLEAWVKPTQRSSISNHIATKTSRPFPIEEEKDFSMSIYKEEEI